MSRFWRLSLSTRNPQSAARREKRSGVNTSVLGMVAKGVHACDSFPCSTSVCGMLYRDENTANTSVLGIVANGMDACDNVSCSTSFAQCVVQRGESTVNTSVVGHGRTMNDALISPDNPPPNNT